MGFIGFFVQQHDIRFVGLAALICVVASFACINLLRHAYRSTGKMKWIWAAVAALAVGFGIWSTHFVAMLSYRPGFVPSYDFALTAASLVIAIIIGGAGLSYASHSSRPSDHFLGGAVVGVAISCMHYVGIYALALEGVPLWNFGAVALSIALGIVLSGAAFAVGLQGGRASTLAGALLLVAAICAMHFTAMAALDLSYCKPLPGAGAIDGFWLSIAVAGMSLVILGAAISSLMLDDADRRRTAREERRQQRDAHRIAQTSHRLEMALRHMAQGLQYYGADGRLQVYNRRLSELLGIGEHIDLTGKTFDEVTKLTFAGSGVAYGEDDEILRRLIGQHRALFSGKGGSLVHHLPDERVLQVSHSPVGDGSWVTTVEDITEKHRSQNRIAHLARHDVLTGLDNRAAFDETFDEALLLAQDRKSVV